MIHWTIRFAALCYVIAVAQMIRKRPARGYWTAGCVLYCAHVAAAFHYAYHWSHAFAERETARQTEALFRIHWGGGIWFNYAFTALWITDVLWWRIAGENRKARPSWVDRGIQSYMAWMFINGAIVFAQGPVRWMGAALALALGLLWLQHTRLDSRNQS